jgi:hypothetical protein
VNIIYLARALDVPPADLFTPDALRKLPPNRRILEEEMANLVADRQLQPKPPRGQHGPRTAGPA